MTYPVSGPDAHTTVQIKGSSARMGGFTLWEKLGKIVLQGEGRVELNRVEVDALILELTELRKRI